MLIHRSTGKPVKIGDKVKRLKPNANGNCPTGQVVGLPENRSGMMVLLFGNNRLESKYQRYGLEWSDNAAR